MKKEIRIVYPIRISQETKDALDKKAESMGIAPETLSRIAIEKELKNVK